MKKIILWIVVIAVIVAVIFVGYKFYYKNYYVPTQMSDVSYFNTADLKADSIHYGSTEQSVIKILGEPEYRETFTDNNVSYELFSYKGNLLLSFVENSLVSLQSSSDLYSFKGIKIGDSVDTVINSFANENLSTFALNQEGSVIGTYLYGTFNNKNLDSIQTTEPVFYGYKTTKFADSSYEIRYGYMNPPYTNNTASANDKIAELTFVIKDDKVAEIDWSATN